MTRRKRRSQPDPDSLHSFQRFRGSLEIEGQKMPVRFKARIGDDGEVELDIHAFRLSRRSWFVKKHWDADRRHVSVFTLTGTSDNGLTFETDSLSFTSLGSRWSGTSNWHSAKPRGECGKVIFRRERTEEAPTVLKFHLKGFECFPRLNATCSLGDIQVAGVTKMEEPDTLTGYILIRAKQPPEDAAGWRTQAEALAEHLRRMLSFAASTMLQAPVLEFQEGRGYEAEVLSQSRQHRPVMRVFHKLDQQPLLDAAVAAWLAPPVESRNLFFAIEWFTMATTYNEVRLVNAMTALENLIDSNLEPKDKEIETRKDFERTRRALRGVIRSCLERWTPERAGAVLDELGPKLQDLNRLPLRQKLYLLADRWQVPLDGISDQQIRGAISARNAIVHSGYHAANDDDPDLWDHMTIVRELVVRFLMTAIGYRGHYLCHVGGYHFEHFPPGAKTEPTNDATENMQADR